MDPRNTTWRKTTVFTIGNHNQKLHGIWNVNMRIKGKLLVQWCMQIILKKGEINWISFARREIGHTTLMHSQKEKGHWYLVNNKIIARAIQRTISIVLHALGTSSASLCGSTQNGAHLFKVFARHYLGKQEYRHSVLLLNLHLKMWTWRYGPSWMAWLMMKLPMQ